VELRRINLFFVKPAVVISLSDVTTQKKIINTYERIAALQPDIPTINSQESQQKFAEGTVLLVGQAKVLDLLQDAVIVRSLNNHITQWSRGAEHLYGYKADEALGCEANHLLKTRFPKSYSAIFLELMERGVWQGIVTQCGSNGKALMVETRWALRYDEDNRPCDILELSTDVTQEISFQRKLDQLAVIVEQSHDAMLSIALDGTIISWNKGAEEIYGYSPSEAVGRNVHILSTPQRRSWVESMLQSVRQGRRVCDVDTFVRHKRGQLITTSTTLSPIRDSSGELCAVSVISRDLTSLRLYEKEVSRLERLDMVGQLAAGIGHEIRNPLTTVRGFLQLFAMRPEMKDLSPQIDLVLSELDSANNIISEFLRLARNRTISFETLQLNEIISSLLPLLRADATMADKQVKTQLTPVPSFLLNEKEISHLILNLARNGLEATPKGGTLTISTYAESDKVFLCVEDQGKGIPDHLLDRIWLPFFTTKERGTGLGLAVCEHIAAQHHATIEAASSSKGTVFKVAFTLSKESASI